MADKILSQEEIDALLHGIEDGKVETVPERPEVSGVLPYDLANQDRIIRGRMPTLDVINDHFTKLFRNTLSSGLRKVVEVSTKGLQMVKFGEFLKTLPVPTSVHIYKMDPLRGYAVLVLDAKLIFTLLDLFFGGTGKTNFRIEGRDFTGIEMRLIQKLVNMIFADIEKAWHTVHPITIQYVRSEMNPNFVGIMPPSNLVITIPFDVELEQYTGRITLCIPYSTIEPIKGKFFSGHQSDHPEMDRDWIERFSNRLKSIEVEVAVELGTCRITVQDLLQLKIGDVLKLEKDVSEPLITRIEGVPKLLGKPGLYGPNKAVQIDGRIEVL
jgi:flagellar motor switch protein FliM